MFADPLALVALAVAAAWACGLNVYAAAFILGFMGARGLVALPAQMTVLEHPVLLAAIATMYFVECFTDKVPGLVSVWDALHTVIRIPAGAVLSAAAMADLGWAAQTAGALAGAGLAAGSHMAKASARAVILTTAKLSFSWGASVTEDALVFLGLWLVITNPMWFAPLFAAWIVLLIGYWPTLKRGSAIALRRLTHRAPQHNR